MSGEITSPLGRRCTGSLGSRASTSLIQEVITIVMVVPKARASTRLWGTRYQLQSRANSYSVSTLRTPSVRAGWTVKHEAIPGLYIDLRRAPNEKKKLPEYGGVSDRPQCISNGRTVSRRLYTFTTDRVNEMLRRLAPAEIRFIKCSRVIIVDGVVRGLCYRGVSFGGPRQWLAPRPHSKQR